MKEAQPQLSILRQAFFVGSIVVCFLFFGASPRSADAAVSATKGQVDLSKSADERGVTELDGEWWYTWNALLEPGESSTAARQLYDMPNIWNKLHKDLGVKSGQGYATFSVDLINIPDDSYWGVTIPEQDTAFRLYMDDRLIASGGQIARDRAHAEPYSGIQTVSVGEMKGSATLTLQVSNFHHYKGGPRRVLSIGPYHELNKQHLVDLYTETLIFLLVSIASIFLLVQWLIDRREVSSLILFGFAVIIAARLGVVNYQPLVQLVDVMPWWVYIHFLYLSMMAAPPLLLLWFYRVYPLDFNGTVVKVLIGLFTLATLFVLFTDPLVFAPKLNYLMLLHLLGIVFGCYGVTRLVYFRRPGGATIAIGLLVLFFCTTHDILIAAQLIKTKLLLMPIGVLTFLLSLMVNLVYLRNNEKKQVESLSQKLMRTNRTLESNVAQRTKELAEKASALEVANQKLLVLANVDGLTQVLNRRAFIEQCELFARSKPRVALILIDVDHFKQVNDNYGHGVGDEVLTRLAALLSKNTRSMDRVGRFGGEEFVLLLQEIEAESVQRYCERLLAQVRALDFSDCTELKGITISAGVVTSVLLADNIDKLLQRADKAMYAVKSSGRDNYRLASDDD